MIERDGSSEELHMEGGFVSMGSKRAWLVVNTL